MESATAEIRSRRCGPNVIAQGIFSGPAPRATSRSAPSAEPPSGGAPFSRAFSVTGAWPPGLSRTQRGFGTISSPPAPVLRMRTSNVRDETLRITTCCVECQPSPSAWPNAKATGSAVISPAALAPRSTSPEPWAATLSPAIDRASPVSRLFRSIARNPGRAWASTAAAPATTAAAGLEPLTVPKRGVPSSLAPGSEVVSATPGAARSGLTRPSKASPREENGAIPPSLPL